MSFQGHKHSEETKKKLRQYHNEGKIGLQKGHILNLGKHPSIETLIKLSESHKGIKHSEESKQKMSLAKSGVIHPFYGKHFSEEHKQKISESLIGHEVTKEARRKISEGHKGKERSEEFKLKMSEAFKGNKIMLGRHLSEETKLKIGLVSKGRKFSEESKLKMRDSRLRYLAKFDRDGRLELTKNWRIAAQKANPSSIETIVCKVLDSLNIDYQTQIKIGKWTADIFISNRNLVIECNGDYWHNLSERILRDAELQKYCDENNINLLWLWEHDIKKDANQLIESELLEANL